MDVHTLPLRLGRGRWLQLGIGRPRLHVPPAMRGMQTARTDLHYISGCIFLLQLWMWSRLPVGRPRVFQPHSWSPVGVDELGPMVAYLWDHVSSPYATTQRAYVNYSNELDILSPSTVSFEHSFHTQYLKYPLLTYYLIVFFAIGRVGAVSG